jgi:hypothetical protein
MEVKELRKQITRSGERSISSFMEGRGQVLNPYWPKARAVGTSEECPEVSLPRQSIVAAFISTVTAD